MTETRDACRARVVCLSGFKRKGEAATRIMSAWAERRGVAVEVLPVADLSPEEVAAACAGASFVYAPFLGSYAWARHLPPGTPVVADFAVNASPAFLEEDWSRARLALRNAFGVTPALPAPPEFQVPFLANPLPTDDLPEPDVIVIDAKPFHALTSHFSYLYFLSELAQAYDHLCRVAGRKLYIYFTSFMDWRTYAAAADPFVADTRINGVATNPLRALESVIIPPQEDYEDYAAILRRARLMITEHGDLADYDLLQAGSLGVPLQLVVRHPYRVTTGMQLMTYQAARLVSPGIKLVLMQAEAQRVLPERPVEPVLAAGRQAPWDGMVLDDLFMGCWDMLLSWAVTGQKDEAVDAAMRGLDNTWNGGMAVAG